ncbi:hypothetical protein EHS25_003762 [Saitozyma podzolica]|uniref:Protein kinase domain-containing protein n=1 Tax=Saitozyma podzolica TaxID=1890683 RepID=A0A427Y3G4_9TREE|nr:hypothetical protein EHS25_003762 [Saitozyma podzolica]
MSSRDPAPTPPTRPPPFPSHLRQASTSHFCPAPSPKRAKSTPSPRSPLSASTGSGPSSGYRYTSTFGPTSTSGSGFGSGSTSTSTSGSSRRRYPYPPRPTLEDKRALTYDGQVVGSPYRSPSDESDLDGRGLPRRRELSVPLLSATLSHFSLSHSSPPLAAPRQPAIFRSSPFRLPSDPSAAPRHPLRSSTSHTPSHPLPRDHVYPSTAPIPHAASFLGSPFSSSKTYKANFSYSGESPSKMPFGTTVAQERSGGAGGGKSVFGHPEWMDRSEWMVEQSLMLDEMADQDGEVEAQAQGLGLGLGLGMGLRIPPRLRRDTSGSIESMEDLSGSGASSTSLLSSGRSSGEQQIRPKCVAVWSSVEQDHDEHDPSTPSRQLFSTEAADALQTSSDTAKAGQLFSPLIGKTVSSTTQASPLQHIILSRDVAKTTCPEVNSPTLAKRTNKPRSRPRSPEDVEELTDTEEPESTRRRRTKEALCETPTIRKPDGSVTGGTAARPACSNRARFDDTAMARSLSSESSTEIYASPSRPLSLRASGGKATPAPFFSAKLSSKVAPPRGSGRPARPFLRRGVTEPTGPSSIDVNLLSAPVQYMHTPPSALFGDVRPSPAAFASTGLIKKKSGITVEIPKFGTASETAAMTKEPTSAISPTSPISPTTVMSGGHGHVGRFVPEKRTSTNSTTGAAGGAGAQKSRGLRRKGSTMFAATGSSGSVVEVCKVFTGSPATPTKPTIQLTPFGLGITTPSPRSPTDMIYPFTSGTFHALSTPPSSDSNPSSEDTPARTMAPHAVPHHLRGPVARTSNPMLAASFRAQGVTKNRAVSGAANRLQRDFEVVQSLGAGEFSQVWKVKDKRGKVFAVKAGKPYTGSKNRLRQLEEVSILHSLSLNPHSNVIQFIDSWEHARRLYIRTELAECGDLARFLEALGTRAALANPAIQHVHNHDLLHLDIKPSNILITMSGSLKLADFGMSTVSSPEGQAVASLSPALPQMEGGEFVWRQEGTMPSPIVDREVEGDREYLCPEALGDGPVGRPADVYSLGILLLEAALNVVLPPNGDGWVNLRSDRFDELSEHYLPRQHGDYRAVDEPTGLPLVSDELMERMKWMMRSEPGERARLEEVVQGEVVRRVLGQTQGGGEGEGIGALVDVEEGWLRGVLG